MTEVFAIFGVTEIPRDDVPDDRVIPCRLMKTPVKGEQKKEREKERDRGGLTARGGDTAERNEIRMEESLDCENKKINFHANSRSVSVCDPSIIIQQLAKS